MARNSDLRRLADWRKRLDRFQSSGLTVTRFCNREKVSPNRFYYWAKQVRQQPQQATNLDLDVDLCEATTLAESSTSVAGIGTPGVDAPVKPGDMVHFSLKGNVQVSVPAERLDAVRCILQWSQDRETVSMIEPNRSSRFQRVITCTD